MDTISVSGAWNLIAFSRDYSNGNIEFYINGVSWSVDGGPKNIPLQLPGVIRIGYSQPSSVGLHGRISCFIIQDEKFNYNQLATAQTDCETSNWGITPGNFMHLPCTFYILVEWLERLGYGAESRRKVVSSRLRFAVR